MPTAIATAHGSLAGTPPLSPHVFLSQRNVTVSPDVVDAERDRRAAAVEAEIAVRRKEISERGRAKVTLADTEETLAELRGRLAMHLGAMAAHARKHEAAMGPIARITKATDEAANALDAARSELSALDADERAAVEAWGRTGEGDMPVLNLDGRRAIDARIADAQRCLNSLSSALEQQKAPLRTLDETGAMLGYIRDGLVVAILYQEAERLAHLYGAAIEDAAAIAGELDGLNQALSGFEGIPIDYMPDQPAIGRCAKPLISHADRSRTVERRIEARGFLLRAHDGSDFTAIATIDDITAASVRWARYANGLRSESIVSNPDTVAEMTELAHENAELWQRLRSLERQPVPGES